MITNIFIFIFWGITVLPLAYPKRPDQAHFPVMGNSASTSFIIPTPRKLSWGRQKEDTVKLEDFLTHCEDDLWRVKGKQGLSVKRIHLTRSIRYVDLAVQECNSFHPNGGERLNPAFVGDQGPWLNTVHNQIYPTTQQEEPLGCDVWKGNSEQPGGVSEATSANTFSLSPQDCCVNSWTEREKLKMRKVPLRFFALFFSN